MPAPSGSSWSLPSRSSRSKSGEKSQPATCGRQYESTFVTFQGRPYMLWASGLQGWTVPGMRRVRYYLTSYKLALPDITRVPPATNIALRRRLATEWKMCARDDSEAIQRRSHPPRWTVCSGATCDCVCGPREAWTEPTIGGTEGYQSKTLTPDPGLRLGHGARSYTVMDM